MTVGILREQHDRVRVLTVSNPPMRNAFTFALAEELADAVRSATEDPDVGALVIAGAAPSFCAGADLAALAEASEEESRAGLQRMYAGFLAVADCPLPTIAAVDGPAVGAGLNLALACDIRLAGPGASFDARFLRLGLHPGGGMTWMLQRAVSRQTARAMTLFGQALDAEHAVRAGLALGDVRATVLDDAVAMAARAASVPRTLAGFAKTTLTVTAEMSDHTEAVAYELVPQLASLASEDFARRIGRARSGGREK